MQAPDDVQVLPVVIVRHELFAGELVDRLHYLNVCRAPEVVPGILRLIHDLLHGLDHAIPERVRFGPVCQSHQRDERYLHVRYLYRVIGYLDHQLECRSNHTDVLSRWPFGDQVVFCDDLIVLFHVPSASPRVAWRDHASRIYAWLLWDWRVPRAPAPQRVALRRSGGRT